MYDVELELFLSQYNCDVYHLYMTLGVSLNSFPRYSSWSCPSDTTVFAGYTPVESKEVIPPLPQQLVCMYCNGLESAANTRFVIRMTRRSFQSSLSQAKMCLLAWQHAESTSKLMEIFWFPSKNPLPP